MTSVYLIDENAIWVDTLDLDLDAGRPANSVLETPPDFDPEACFAAWSGTEWLVRPMAEFPVPPEPPPPPVPASVTMRQARIALSRAGVLKSAEEAIAAMPGQPGEEARIEWAFAAELRRDHPLVMNLGDTLGLDAAAVDDLFRSAASL